MSIDISQFHDTFLEEANEHLAALEQGLLELESTGATDMTAIFRAAHSIKGGAATFGFSLIADFTHVVESVLEKARDGVLAITIELTSELLKALDITTALVQNAKAGQPDAAPAEYKSVLAALHVLDQSNTNLATGAGSGDTATGSGQQPATFSGEQIVYAITFRPHPHLLKTGSEPLNLFRELSELGELHVTAHTDGLPNLEDFDATNVYLWWTLQLFSHCPESDVRDVFLFVEDDADITIDIIAGVEDPVAHKAKLAAAAAQAAAEVRTVTPFTDRREGDRRQGDRRQDSAATNGGSQQQFIRVAIDKVDSLINLVGELVTTNAMVTQHSGAVDLDEHQNLAGAISTMTSHTRNLQEAIMSIRMMPIDFVFSRFPRMVRDTAQKLGKQVVLETHGAQTELDKTVIEQMSDPLTHLVRNAIDHGIELPADRIAASKPEIGTVHLSAYYRGGSVMIDIRDDGKGLNREKILAKAVEKDIITPEQAQHMPDQDVWELIFASGFSTADKVTDVSGRGVGMDVVRKNIKSLGGSIHITSEAGYGSCFSISLPLTLAILDCMATRVGTETYLIPLLNILESFRPTTAGTRRIQGDVEVVDFRGEYLPLVRVHDVMQVPIGAAVDRLEDGIAVVVETEFGRIALFVDYLLGERQVVIKNIEDNYKHVRGISGATILGDGRVALILDLPGLVRLAQEEGRYVHHHKLTTLYPQPSAVIPPAQQRAS